MSRMARKISSTGIYHVMMRGVNRQQIFFDEEDRRYMTDRLGYYKREAGFQLYAYCLMGNHLHILIKVADEPLGAVFRKICASFVFWYNKKYQRTGYLFQDRFKSEAVEDDKYFLTVLRYILQNPVKGGLCKSVFDYDYSSIKEYTGERRGITDTAFAIEMTGRKGLLEFLSEINDDECLDFNENFKRGVTDEDAQGLILKETGGLSLSGASFDELQQVGVIRRLYKGGVSIRQISRLTGLSKSRVEKALK